MALSALFLQGFEKRVLNRQREIWIEQPGRHWRFMDVHVSQCHGVGRKEWRAASEKLVGNAAESILIAFRSHLAQKLLRGHIQRRPGRSGRMLDRGGYPRESNAKVCQQRPLPAMEQEVCGLAIMLRDTVMM